MQGNKGRDTLPELAVRRELFARGLRYRVSFRPVPSIRRTADVVFTRARLAVFIDGCFWHACPLHYKPPKTNGEFWRQKIVRNCERDIETTAWLEAHGWKSLRFWSHQPPQEIADQICLALNSP